jgi:hypothetical protein
MVRAAFGGCAVTDILFVASSQPKRARRALTALERQFPESSIALVLCPELEPMLDACERERIVFIAGVEGSRARFLRASWWYRYDWVAVVWGGDSGYLTMKLAAFVVRPGSGLLCINENGDSFEWRWRSLGVVLRHVRWRVRSRTKASVYGQVADLSQHLLQVSVGEALGLIVLLLRSAVLLAGRRDRSNEGA